MQVVRVLILAGVVAMSASFTPAAEALNLPQTPYGPKPGARAVETLLADWKDADRDRPVPAKIYYPKAAAKPSSVIIFSHGLGGSRLNYEYLGRHWASYGFVSVHLQHKGSDCDVWQGKAQPIEALRDALKDPRNALERVGDVKFAIDEMERLNEAAGPLKGRLDLKHVGMAGHSFGAFTTLAIAGQTFSAPGGREIRVPDPRVKAAIAMSPSPPRTEGDLEHAYGSIKLPVFHMTGTLDDSPITDTKAADRLLPFRRSRQGDRYLVVFEGGDHMVFSGRGRGLGVMGPRRHGEHDALFQAMICTASTAFWDAYLLDDAAARRWLAGGGFVRMLGDHGEFEKKLDTNDDDE